jgi:hypothetical protein
MVIFGEDWKLAIIIFIRIAISSIIFITHCIRFRETTNATPADLSQQGDGIGRSEATPKI